MTDALYTLACNLTNQHAATLRQRDAEVGRILESRYMQQDDLPLPGAETISETKKTTTSNEQIEPY